MLMKGYIIPCPKASRKDYADGSKGYIYKKEDKNEE